MARSRQMGAPKRTTRLRIAGPKLEAAEAFLHASLEAESSYEGLTIAYNACPKHRLLKRRKLKDARFKALLDYWRAVRAARDIANLRHDPEARSG